MVKLSWMFSLWVGVESSSDSGYCERHGCLLIKAAWTVGRNLARVVVSIVRFYHCVMIGFDHLGNEASITKRKNRTIVDSLHRRFARDDRRLQLRLFNLLDVLEGRDQFFSGLNFRTGIGYLFQDFFLAMTIPVILILFLLLMFILSALGPSDIVLAVRSGQLINFSVGAKHWNLVLRLWDGLIRLYLLVGFDLEHGSDLPQFLKLLGDWVGLLEQDTLFLISRSLQLLSFVNFIFIERQRLLSYCLHTGDILLLLLDHLLRLDLDI